jgi:hypothetical protein
MQTSKIFTLSSKLSEKALSGRFTEPYASEQNRREQLKFSNTKNSRGNS